MIAAASSAKLRCVTRPDLFEYTDYRAYLRDVFAHDKAQRPGFSHRFFAARAGFSASNFLSLVMQGKRNLGPEGIRRVAQGLSLGRGERDFFENLVLMNQAETEEARNHYYGRLARSPHYRSAKRFEREQFEAYSTWYTLPIRELASVKGFRPDPEWIAHTLRPAIKPAQAQEALERLLVLGLLRRKNGTVEPDERDLTTGPEVRLLAIRNFHRSMIRLAEEALDSIPPAERNVSCVTMALSDEQVAQVRDRIERFRAELLEIGSDRRARGKPGKVMQVNVQLFPLSRDREKEK